MQGNAWVHDIVGALPELPLWQLLQLWDCVMEVDLQLAEDDIITGTADSVGIYTSKSAYERFFSGSIVFEPHKRLWKS